MKLLPLVFALATAAFVSCERHDWEETKKLSEPHHGHGAHASHEEGHGEHAEKHAEGGAAGHEEKKEAAH